MLYFDISLNSGGNGTIANPYGFAEWLETLDDGEHMITKGVREASLSESILCTSQVHPWNGFWRLRSTEASLEIIGSGSLSNGIIDCSSISLKCSNVSYCSMKVSGALVIHATSQHVGCSYSGSSVSINWADENNLVEMSDCCVCASDGTHISLVSTGLDSNYVCRNCGFSDTAFSETGTITKSLSNCVTGKSLNLQPAWDSTVWG